MSDLKEQNSEQLTCDQTPEDHSLPEDLIEIASVKPEQPPLRFYEIIYGILFDPVPTMKRIALNPPLGVTLLIVVLLSLIGLLTNLYTSAHGIPSDLKLNMGIPLPRAENLTQALRAAAPLLAILGALFYFLKWFFYSALLHLVADFYGGRGTARAVFVIYGLAGLPEVFLIPLQVITTWLSPGLATGIMALTNLILFIWGIVLLTIGLREAHGFSTGRALAVIFTPALAAVLLAIVSMVGLMVVISSVVPPSW